MIRPALFALSLLLAAPAAAETLRIATEGAYLPWNGTDASGRVVGFEVDLARDLCRRIGATCDIIAQDWDGILPGLQQGRYDVVMAGVAITDKRAETVDFTVPYAADPATFAVPSGSPLAAALPAGRRIDLTARDPAAVEAVAQVGLALVGRTVGVQRSTTHAQMMAELWPAVTVRLYDSVDHAALDLAAGRVDAVLTAGSAIEAVAKAGKPVAPAGPLFSGGMLGRGVAAATRKRDALAGRLSGAIAAAGRDGTTAALSIKWFGLDLSLPR